MTINLSQDTIWKKTASLLCKTKVVEIIVGIGQGSAPTLEDIKFPHRYIPPKDRVAKGEKIRRDA